MRAMASMVALVPLILVLVWAFGRGSSQTEALVPSRAAADPALAAEASQWPDASALRFLRPFALTGAFGLLALGVAAPWVLAAAAALGAGPMAGVLPTLALSAVASTLLPIAAVLVSGGLAWRLDSLRAGEGADAWPRGFRLLILLSLTHFFTEAAVAPLLDLAWLEPLGLGGLGSGVSGTARWPAYLAGGIALLAMLWGLVRSRAPAVRVAARIASWPAPGWLVWTIRVAIAGGIASVSSGLLESVRACGGPSLASIGHPLSLVAGCTGLAYQGVCIAVLLHQRPRFRQMANRFAPTEGWTREHCVLGWLLALAWVQAWAGLLASGIAVTTVFMGLVASGFGSVSLRNAPAIGLVLVLVWLFTWRPPARQSDAASEDNEAAGFLDDALEPGAGSSTAHGPH